MFRVVIESPYAGKTEKDHEENVAYARRAMKDALTRGEAPLASHLLYTQPGILNDAVPNERQLGINAGLEWMRFANRVALYLDRGKSPGMKAAEEYARIIGVPVVERYLDK